MVVGGLSISGGGQSDEQRDGGKDGDKLLKTSGAGFIDCRQLSLLGIGPRRDVVANLQDWLDLLLDFAAGPAVDYRLIAVGARTRKEDQGILFMS